MDRVGIGGIVHGIYLILHVMAYLGSEIMLTIGHEFVDHIFQQNFFLNLRLD